MSRRKFLVSVIMPVYNTEEFVEEAIESLLEQTIGFEKNIQLILVNDGSSDRSGAICRRYARMYPENIIYKKCHNHGVSAARNYGLRFATGEWVNFTDSDDKWHKVAFAAMAAFTEKQGSEVNILSPRIRFFDGRKGYHILDYKFEKTRVVDIEEDYNYIQLHVPCWFRRSKLPVSPFNTKMESSEDARLITSLIMRDGKYGVVREAMYWYRKRNNNSITESAIQEQAKKAYYYTTIFEEYYFYLIKQYLTPEGGLPKYIQFILLYEIQWRLWQPIEKAPCEDREKYKKDILYILSLIDDELILNYERITAERKVYILRQKYGADVPIEFRSGRFYYGEKMISNFVKRGLRVDCIECRNGQIHIFGRLASFLPKEKLSLFVEKRNGEREKLVLRDNPNSRLLSFDGTKCLEAYFFELFLPNKTRAFSFLASVDDSDSPVRMVINPGKFAKIKAEKNSYYYSRGRILSLSKSRKSISNIGASIKRLAWREFRSQLSLLSHRYLKVATWRSIYWIMRALHKKPVWVISDRANMANDNGEAFFRYMQKEHRDKVDCYFRIDKKSPDYGRLEKIGRVVDYNSFRAKMLTAMASKIVSAHADDGVYRPFAGAKNYWMSDLFDYDFVFLQHGITKDDLSGWLIRTAKNIRLFVTSTRPERNSIMQGNYLYGSDNIKLTGFARHDRLVSSGGLKKTIVVIPTWRKKLAGMAKLNDGVKSRNNNFTKTNYYQFYSSLISDGRIRATMKKKGYHGLFVVHPNHLANASDFRGNKEFRVLDKPAKYAKLFSESSLMVTDYSSVAFEFAYLNKPVIYTQSDREEFYDGQIYDEGYFSYENDGFGPVCLDYESTVAAIVNAIENDCRQPKKYADRVAKTFAFHDNKDCERIYGEIVKLNEKLN